MIFFTHAGLLVLYFLANSDAKATRKKTKPPKNDEFVDPMKHDIFIATRETFDTLVTKHRNKDGVATVLHFSSKNPQNRKFISDVFNEAAKKTKGMVRMVAINCEKNKEFCRKNMNQKLEDPLVIMYPPNPMPPFILKDATEDKIVKVAMGLIPGGNVKILTTQNFNSFQESDPGIPKVIVVSDKESPESLYKALSNSFSDRVNFGFISKDGTDLVSKVKTRKKPPFVMIYAAGTKSPEFYDGKLSYEPLHSWINVKAETYVKGGGIETGNSSPIAKPWRKEKIPQLFILSASDVCLKANALCAVYVSDGKPPEKELSMLESLSADYSEPKERGLKFRWMWLDVTVEKEFQKLLGIEDSSQKTHFMVINPGKRKRYISKALSGTKDRDSIKQLLEMVASGDARFVSFPQNKLPTLSHQEIPEKVPVSKKPAVQSRGKNKEL